jgi:predicted O-methyltransferase YrrM
MKATFEEAAEEICKYLALDKREFEIYAAHDDIGGWSPDKPTWPIGSLWDVEGRILYALTRLLRPSIVLELGTWHGCSTRHLQAAVVKNRKGKVITVDRAPLVDLDGEPRIEQVRGEMLDYAKEEPVPIDLMFEDTGHSVETTRDAINGFMPWMESGGVIVCHDAEHFLVGEDVREGMRQALGDDFLTLLIEPGDCGLGFWRKP